MKIVIAGCERLGFQLFEFLTAKGHHAVLIGQSDELKRIEKLYDGSVISGNPGDRDVLEKAGIENAEVFLAVSGDDNVNIMAAQMAKDIYEIPLVGVNLSDHKREAFCQEIGLITVSTTKLNINQILKIIEDKEFAEFPGYLNPDVSAINPLENWVGGKLKDIKIPHSYMVTGVLRNFKMINPEPQLVIQQSDTFIISKKK